MRFWDSSAIVPLLVEEPSTERITQLLREGPEMIVWWGTLVECASALSRIEREGHLTASETAQSFKRLDTLAANWIQIEPVDEIRVIARRFLRVHPLRSADALQLAAAFIASENRPNTLEVVTLDERLNTIAEKEGFLTVTI
jgi:uncharacterized protein